MGREIEHMKETINKARINGEAELIANREYLQRIVNYLDTLRRENRRMRELCDKYEEEHDSTFTTWQETMRRHYEAIKYIKNNKLVDVDILLDILEGEEE